MTFEERLIQARKEAGLNQEEASKLIGIDQGKICKIEKGGRKICASVELPVIAKAYKKPIGWFYEESDENVEFLTDALLKVYYPDETFCFENRKKINEIVTEFIQLYMKHQYDI